jgi:membrane protein
MAAVCAASLPKGESVRDRSPSIVTSLVLVAASAAIGVLRAHPGPTSDNEADDPVVSSQNRREPIAVHLRRAQETGRGRDATSPAQIPWRGWKDILWRTVRRASEDRLLAVSAGIVFYGLLALFPAVTAFVSCYGLFASPVTVSDHLSFLATVMPAEAYSIVHDQIARVVSKGNAGLSLGFAGGLAFALWSTNAGMKALVDALNVVYDEVEKRGIIRLNLVSLTFTIVGIVAMLSAVGAIMVAPLVLTRIGLGAMTEIILSVARWPGLLIGMLIGLSILYRYGPSRREAKWEWISVGAVFATLTWFAGSGALSYYFSNFAEYDVAYGSLGAAIATMMWIWMSAIVILFGAELNSEIEHQTARDTTVGIEKPIGARGAAMADTVGAAQTP